MADLLAQTYENRDYSTLRPHPKNPNIGDIDAIRDSIRTVGFYGAVIIQRSSGLTVAGWHRAQAALQEGITSGPVIVADLTDEQAERLLAADNQINRLGRYDDEVLIALLQDIQDSEEGLIGSGFTDDDLDLLLRGSDSFTNATGSFIGGQEYVEGPVTEQSVEEAPLGRDLYALAYTVTGAQRLVITSALNAARARLGDGTSAEALVLICQEFTRG